MKLYAFAVGETNASENDCPAFDGDTPAFVALPDGDPLPDGYVDVTSAEKWAKFGPSLVGMAGTPNANGFPTALAFPDALALAAQIEIKIVETALSDYSAWNELSTAEKLVACQWLPTKIPLVDFIATVAANDRKPTVKAYIALAQQAWAKRMEAAEALIFTTMPAASRHQLLKDTDLLSSIYLRGGILTNAADGTDGIGDYLASTSGYSGAGFVEAGYAVNAGQTRSGIATAALAILNGNY